MLFLAVYPNPAHCQVTITSTANIQAGTLMALLDVSGRIVYQAPLLSNKQTINLERFADGVYVLRVTNAIGTVKMVKVVKE